MNKLHKILDDFVNKNSGLSRYLFLILFFAVLILRIPTLFNDYYEADELAAIVQARDYIAGYIPLVDFAESKHFLYHSLFKFSYSISYNYGWVLVHLITVFIVFITSVFIFFAGKRISSYKTGALASLFYAVMISSFNRQFMATNGEIVYNLFFAMGIYFFILFLDSDIKKGMIFFIFILLAGLGAVSIKFHGVIFLIYIFFFIAVYNPFRKQGLFCFYFRFLFSVLILSAIILIAGYYSGNGFCIRIISEITSKLFYASAPGRNFSFLDLLARFLFRQGLLSLWHYVLWIPAFICLWKFIKSGLKEAELKESSVLIFFIITYLMVFGGGARVYFHYFMAAYVPLALVAAISIEKLNNKHIMKIKRNLPLLIMIPAIFFFAWNTKDVIIKHFFPDAFYHEGRTLYWTRCVLVGTYDDYLLPHNDYRETVEYVIKTTGKDDPVFVWGDGPYINYFSDRRIGGHHMWMKGFAYGTRDLYNKGDARSVKTAEAGEASLIGYLSRKKPVLIIDVSGNGLSNFRVNIREARYLYRYIEKNYLLEKNINGMDIYRARKH